MENELDGVGATGVSRGQNQLHLLPEDWQAAATAIAPLLDRIDPAVGGTQLLVITSDVDASVGTANRLASLRGPSEVGILAATDTRRAARVLRGGPAHILAGTPEVLIGLLQSATLKLDSVRAVVLAWVDDLGPTATGALETIMGDVPKDAARYVLAASASPGVEQLVERYARRARRVQPAGADAGLPVSLSYLAVGELARPMAVRRILDALDPESAFIVTRTPESRRDVEAQLRALGYGGDASAVRVGETPDAAAEVVVLYDFPGTAEPIRAIHAARPGARVVALVTPRQVPALRRLAGGAISPLALPEAAVRARSREERLRDEVRATLAAGQISRELLTLEPLLADHDGIEVAAALLRLLEAERVKPHAPLPAAEPAMTKLFINVGEMDNVRPGDLVGAITNEAGIGKADLGRVEIREKHSTVEVATPVANTVVAKLNGVTIRGRRALVKIDEERPRRDAGARPGRGGRDSGSRPDRGAPRRDRPSRPTRPR